MTLTIQFPAPANVVLQTVYDVCTVKYKLKSTPTINNFIKPKIYMAYVSVLISLSSAHYIFITKQLTPTLCELTVECAFGSSNKIGGGELIEDTARIFESVSDKLEQQGYIK